SSTATQVVIVDDITAPVAPVLDTVRGECSTTVSVTPTATDACKGSITGTTSDALTYSTQGTHTITWTFNDGNGNSSTATQIVVVKDVTPPAVPTLATLTGCSVTAVAPTTTDNCSGTITGTTTDPLSYSSVGTYTIRWTFTDASGNASQANQTVTIVASPTISGATSTNVGYTSQLSGSRTAAALNPWTSSNTSVATVSNTGLVTGVTGGTTTITYTDNLGCSSSITFTVLANDLLVWGGTTSSSWSEPTNWVKGNVPTAQSDVLIPSGSFYNPQIDGADATAFNITIDAGATLTLSRSAIFNVKGNLNNSGNLVMDGTLILSGSLPQSFPGAAGTIGNMNNLTISNSAGVALNKNIAIAGRLEVTSGSLSLGNADIRLLSTSSSDASVGQVTATSFNYNGSGRFVVERFISNGGLWRYRKWRLLNSPLREDVAQSIFSQWQNNGVASTTEDAEIWGANGSNPPSASSNGLAYGGGYSMIAYSSNTDAWVNV
ncbi:MAG: Ig-like domain-containing protein, partial [Chitinophagaceae bacterium]